MAKYYGVKRGRRAGIYTNWAACKAQVHGFPGCEYQVFRNKKQARAYVFEETHRRPLATNMDRLAEIYDRQAKTDCPVPCPCRNCVLRVAEKAKPMVAYTDGSCLNNGFPGARAGWGIFWPQNDRSRGGKVEGEQTSNRGELTAIDKFIDDIFDLKQNNFNFIVASDSEYARNCIFVWSEKWEGNGWITSTGSPVENQDLIRRIRSRLRYLVELGIALRIHHVPAHRDCEGNIIADRLANFAAGSTEDEITLGDLPDLETTPSAASSDWVEVDAMTN